MDAQETQDLMSDVAVVVKAALSKAIDPLSAEIRASQAENEELHNQIAPLQRELADAQRANSGLVKRFDDIQAENEELRGQIVSLTERLVEVETREIPGIPELPELPDIPALVKEAVAEIPAPENGRDGQDADMQAVERMVADQVEKAVGAIPAPQDGKSVTVDDVAPLIAEAVSKAVANIPVPKDGKDGIDGRDGKDGEPGQPGEKGLDGKDGRDGVDVADLVRGENGHIIATLSNGVTRDLGSFKGDPGRDGRDGDPGEPGPQGEKGMDGATGRDGQDGEPGPIGEKGEPGDNGKDGLSLENFNAELDETGLVLRLSDGEREFEKRLPFLVDRGIWKEGEYSKGSVVSCFGSMWIAQEDTKEKPNSSKAWRLAVKRGSQGPKGPEGKMPDGLDE